jgi:hypothetical protein
VHARKVRCASSHLHPSNGRPGTDEKIFWSTNKVPLIIDRFQTTLHCFLAQARRVHAMLFFLHGEGPRSRCYGRITTLRLFVQPCDEDEQFFFTKFYK